MLFDDVTIHIKAGQGGKGGVYFNKAKMALGPTGGSGGDGASVYFEGVSDIGALSQFRYKKNIIGTDGEDGKKQCRDGTNGEPLVIKIPVGTVIHNLETGWDKEITGIGERILVAKGGNGGKGNFFIRSSRNTSPRQFKYGLLGDEYDLRLELKLIADVGLIGLPNVGKSSLLNALTNAKSKVANYQFTTLDPHLGVYYELILADIPGLIEGASEGKGLGIKFLRHIERTRVLFHLIAADSVNATRDYATVREELERYNPALLKKKEYVLLSRADEVAEKDLKKKITALKKKNKETYPLSVLDDKQLASVEAILRKITKEKKS